jgi:hypothetical protein
MRIAPQRRKEHKEKKTKIKQSGDRIFSLCSLPHALCPHYSITPKLHDILAVHIIINPQLETHIP